MHHKTGKTKCVFEFKDVYLQDLLKVFKKLKASKSAGYEKDGAEEIAAPLLHLINSSLRESVFPTSEKCANITPVYTIAPVYTSTPVYTRRVVING